MQCPGIEQVQFRSMLWGDEDVEASFVTIRKGYQFVLKQITPGKSKWAKQCINKCKKEEELIVQIDEDFGLL